MARPERTNVDYFPHPVDQGQKMGYIKKKYHHEGYSVWYQLIEEMGDANNHYLDLSSEMKLMLMSSSLMTSETTLTDIITDLVKLEWADKDLWENHRIVFSETFIESIQDAYLKRKNKCITINGLRELIGDKLQKKRDKLYLSTDDNTQRKEKKTKVEKTKEIYHDGTVEMNLTDLMIKNILELNPNFKKPNLQAWCKDFDLMIRIDKRVPENISRLMNWVKHNPFWSKNILSPGKLRKQYDRLTMEAGNLGTAKTDSKYDGIG